MSVILAIDTSTHACSCALNKDGDIEEIFELIPRQHAAKLLPMISGLLNCYGIGFSDLDAVAYGQGPGSFTGLRIAAGVAQGIAMGANLPVVPVSSLASLALQMRSESGTALVFSTLDARIDEVYWGFYKLMDNTVVLLGEEGLCKPESLPVTLPAQPGSVLAAGTGLDYLERMPAIYRNGISLHRSDLHPRAGIMAELAVGLLQQGKVQLPEEVTPVYLRDNVTHA
jgi:tRNA threonylcarbamoyladenosine biosynthesis protein TsaB